MPPHARAPRPQDSRLTPSPAAAAALAERLPASQIVEQAYARARGARLAHRIETPCSRELPRVASAFRSSCANGPQSPPAASAQAVRAAPLHGARVRAHASVAPPFDGAPFRVQPVWAAQLCRLKTRPVHLQDACLIPCEHAKQSLKLRASPGERTPRERGAIDTASCIHTCTETVGIME